MDNKWFIDIIKLDSKSIYIYILFGMRSLQNENE
jgi:hypothetical protein